MAVMSGCTSATTTTADVAGTSCSMTTARKPDVSMGAKSILPQVQAAPTWKISVDDEDDDLMDDDELLTEEDRKPAEPPKSMLLPIFDCSAGCCIGVVDQSARRVQMTAQQARKPVQIAHAGGRTRRPQESRCS